jgi:hypothetical protein
MILSGFTAAQCQALPYRGLLLVYRGCASVPQVGGKAATPFRHLEIHMKSLFIRSAIATIATVLAVTSFNACRQTKSSADETPDTSTYRPEATPATQFERDLKFIRDGHFSHIWVFSRKDGKELTREDSDALRTNAPKVVDWVTTDGNKKVIGGSNFPIEPANLAALEKRFKVEDYSGK